MWFFFSGSWKCLTWAQEKSQWAVFFKTCCPTREIQSSRVQIQLLSHCGIGWQQRRWCTVQCTCGPVGNPQEILRRSAHFCPHIFATHRTPGSERIVRHVVFFGSRSQTAEEPPGCKSRTLCSSLTCERPGDIEKRRGGRGVVKRAPVPPKSHLNCLMCQHLSSSVFIGCPQFV